MGTMYVPSIWDYIGQAGDKGVDAFKSRTTERQGMKERADASQIQQNQFLTQLMMEAVMRGGMFTPEANKNPLGMTFQPSQRELAAGIAANPEGTPSLEFLPGMTPSMPNMPAMPNMRVAKKPVTDDQYRMAGLPTRNARDIESAQGNEARLKLQTDKFGAFSPILTEAAGRYVSSAIADHGKELTIRDARMIADNAFRKFLTEQPDAAQMGVQDPEMQAFAKRFFDQAAMQEAAQSALRVAEVQRRYNVGGSTPDPMGPYKAMQQTVNRLTVERDMIQKPYARFFSAPADAQEVLLAQNPMYAEAKKKSDSIDQRLMGLNQAMATFMATGQIHPDTEKLLTEGTGEQPPTAGSETPPPTTAKSLTIEQINRAVTTLRQVKGANAAMAQQQFDAAKIMMTPADRQAIASRTGLTP